MKLQNIIILSLVFGVVTFIAIDAGRCCGKNNPAPKPSVVERIKDTVSNLIHGQKESKNATKKCDENCKCDADCICSDTSGNKCSCSQQNIVVQQENIAENDQEENKESSDKEEAKKLNNITEIAQETDTQTTEETIKIAENLENQRVVVDEIQDSGEAVEDVGAVV